MGDKSSGYDAQVKSPGQILVIFSLVLKVAEKRHFCWFPKGERNIFAWTQDFFSLDGKGDNSDHMHEKKTNVIFIIKQNPLKSTFYHLQSSNIHENNISYFRE